MRFKIFISFSILLALSACVSKFATPQIVYGDKSTLSFSGKGAAAGMMMDAYMGGAGVAIGIAIDEGIAKDILQIFQADLVGSISLRWCIRSLTPMLKTRVTNANKSSLQR